MYAIFEDGGKQYKVSEGDTLLVERRDLEDGQAELTFDKVMFLGEGDGSRIGTPFLDGASVTAKIDRELKTPKVTGVKFKRRKGYMKKIGHRQQMIRVTVSQING